MKNTKNPKNAPVYRQEDKPILILTRRIEETINIGDDIQITVLGIKGNQVRLGVTAPKEIPVHREEIYERIKKENEKTEANPA